MKYSLPLTVTNKKTKYIKDYFRFPSVSHNKPKPLSKIRNSIYLDSIDTPDREPVGILKPIRNSVIYKTNNI
jgi:hypothetical protein